MRERIDRCGDPAMERVMLIILCLYAVALWAIFSRFNLVHEPEEVLSRLDALFIAVERVATVHGLEKIKAIGDAFMAAAGLLRETKDPLGSAVRCGLQMATTSVDAQLGWVVRVGVHVGPVVAGLVDQERPRAVISRCIRERG
jgi:class 3 adenylate cyclase